MPSSPSVATSRSSPELETLVGEYPYRERFRAQLMLALYRCGRQAESLDFYRQTRKLLDDELGLEPAVELQQLERAILVQDPTLSLAAGADARSGTSPLGRSVPSRGSLPSRRSTPGSSSAVND